MRTRRLVAGLSLVGLLAACGGGGGTAVEPTAAGDSAATLELIETAVDVRAGQASDFEPGQDQQGLAIGDDVRTDVSGFGQVLYPDGSLTRVAEGAVFRVVRLEETAGSVDVEISVEVGRAWNRVSDLGDDGAFRVETSVATATVRGTAFDIDCRSGCRFSVFEGELEVAATAGDAPISLQPGQAVVVAQDGTPGPVVAVLADSDPWIADNLSRDEDDGFPAVQLPAGPDAAEISAAGVYDVTLVVQESNDPNAPRGARNEVAWTVEMDCAEGPCDGTISTTEGGGVIAALVFTGQLYEIDEQGEQGTVECNELGIVAYDRRTTGELAVTSATETGEAASIRGDLTEALTPRADAIESGCVTDQQITRVTTFVGATTPGGAVSVTG